MQLRKKITHTIYTFGLGYLLSLAFELLRERLIVQKGPGVVEFVVPCTLQVLHGHHEVAELFVADQGK